MDVRGIEVLPQTFLSIGPIRAWALSIGKFNNLYFYKVLEYFLFDEFKFLYFFK
jgi:hypothetical protein